MEQQRQMIQRQLKELDSQEAVHVRGHGHENFVIQKKIMSRVNVIYCRVGNDRETLIFLWGGGRLVQWLETMLCLMC